MALVDLHGLSQGDNVIWMRVGGWDVKGGANRSIDLLF
jgi:hypothetical protein